MTTVLIIEDNDEVRDNMREILELANYNVQTARNGKEGLEKAQKVDPDVILCDIMMPELDGYGVLRGLSNNPKTRAIPFIYVTAKTEKADLRKGMDLGADDYLVKPFTGDDLLSLINARLKKIKVLRESSDVDTLKFEKFLENKNEFSDIFEVSDKIIKKTFRKKDLLFNEGDTAKYLYYLVSGKVKMFRTNEQGKEYITQIYKPGDFFGYSSLLDTGTYHESSVTMEDVEVASILKQDFFQMLAMNSGLYSKFIQFISSDLSESNDKLIQLAYNSARKKVAEAILFIGRKTMNDLDDNSSFPTTRDDISAVSGISPESVSRNLTDLRNEKLIDFHNGTITILNFKKLSGLKN